MMVSGSKDGDGRQRMDCLRVNFTHVGSAAYE